MVRCRPSCNDTWEQNNNRHVIHGTTDGIGELQEFKRRGEWPQRKAWLMLVFLIEKEGRSLVRKSQQPNKITTGGESRKLL